MAALLPVTLWHQAVAAVDPVLAVRRTLRREGRSLCAGEIRWPLDRGRVRLVGIGKAACGMAVALEKVCGDLLDDGLVVTKEGTRLAQRVCRVVEAGHPVPDKRGLRAAEALERFLAGGREDDLVICCISGGASALLPAPAPPLTLDDKVLLTQGLLASGADIARVNAVRKHCSRLKGGGLARRAAPARLVGLLISDVPGDDPAVIGSGLTVADPSTYGDALAVLEDFGLADEVPPAVVAHLRTGAAGGLPETPKADDPCFDRVDNLVIADNAMAGHAAAAWAEAHGYAVHRCGLAGEAREAAVTFAARSRELADAGEPTVLIGGGETTVHLDGDPGRGGRNQEFALACARELAGDDRIRLIAAGTDGDDGPTDAAGGIVDGGTWRAIADAGLDPADHLARHDAYPALAAGGALFAPGRTGTNVMDLAIAVING